MSALCEDCPPQGYPTEKTRCRTCPRRYNSSIALQRITDALCEDILTMSDEEVLQECRDQGLDPAEEAEKGQAIIEQAIAQASARRIPADDRRYPPGCPDGDWCRGNRMCFWDCRGNDIGDAP